MKTNIQPITEKEKQNILSNIDNIKLQDITCYFEQKKVVKSIQVGFTPRGEIRIEEKIMPTTCIKVDKLPIEYIEDRILINNMFFVCSYLRALKAGHTHRESRYYAIISNR